VNRGWVPKDLKDHRMHLNGIRSGTVQGILYRGDPEFKYSLPNEPSIPWFSRVSPYDLSCMNQMKNFEEASTFMLLQYDPNEDKR